jgi:hydrogenase nickel incorporation protein HypA/HybF
MHELSVAYSIVELVEERARKEGAGKVTRVELEIGEMAGIEYYALEFAWDVATKESLLNSSELIINKIEATAVCSDCNTSFQVNSAFDPCPSCGSFRSEVIKGKELRVASFIIDT